jgi:hypothetical protein
MANTQVFTGADGSITLAPSQTPEGDKTKALVSGFSSNQVVGRAQQVRVEVKSEVKAFHEIGQRYAAELRAGNVTIQGTIGRAYLNGALLILLLGDAAGKLVGTWVPPTFNISLLLTNPAAPDISSNITLGDVKIDQWSFHMPENDFVLESVTFQARYLTVAG